MLPCLSLKGWDQKEEKYLFSDQTPAASNLDFGKLLEMKTAEWNALCYNLPN